MPGYTTQNPNAPRNRSVRPPVVTIGNIPPDSASTKYNTGSNPLSQWTDYKIRNRFEKDYHRYMLGITSPAGFQGATVAFTQLANPTLLWISEWTASRFNEKPQIPNPAPVDNNWVLLDEEVSPVMVVTNPADGTTPLYRISGIYVYGHKQPDSVTVNNAIFPRPPWLDDAFSRNVPPSLLTQNLINSQGTIPLPTGIPKQGS